MTCITTHNVCSVWFRSMQSLGIQTCRHTQVSFAKRVEWRIALPVGAGRRGSALAGGSVVERLTKRRDKNVRFTLVLEHFWRAWTSGSICMGRGPIISFQNPRKILNRVETFTTWPLERRVRRTVPIPDISPKFNRSCARTAFRAKDRYTT